MTTAVDLKIEGLSLSFGAEPVLKQIDLHIAAGEFFAFLGPSGSGKSTLLRSIAGFGPRPTGHILIGDVDVTDLPPWKRNVGMVFQSYALWPHMSVRKNVAFGLEERKLPAAEIKERVAAALDLVGLLELAERRPSQLSGGQQQRVALARTIVIEPRILLLDEPLSNLDANLRVQMRRDLLDLQRKLSLTTVFVTHDQEEANTTSDRIAVLDQGVIQQIGSPMELYDHPTNRFVAKFLGTANVLDGELQRENGQILFRAGPGIRVPLNATTEEGRSIVFRPQNVDIHTAGTEPIEGAVSLTGVLRHKEFLGGLIRYGVEVDGQMILVDESHQRGQQALGIGETVGLGLNTDQIMVLSD